MTDFFELRMPAAASRDISCGSVNPAAPSPPILKKFRRERPSQVCFVLSAGSRIVRISNYSLTEFRNRLAEGQRDDRPAGMVKVMLPRVDAQMLVNCRQNILWTFGIVLRKGSFGIG
jgi:hypothetical protein